MNVVWREWYSDESTQKLIEFGTLGHEEDTVVHSQSGAEAAREIAESRYSSDGEQFRDGGKIVILEPEEWAGTYEVTVDYEPVFYAFKAT